MTTVCILEKDETRGMKYVKQRQEVLSKASMPEHRHKLYPGGPADVEEFLNRAPFHNERVLPL